MRLNDAITGGALVVFAVAEIAYARTFPALHGQSYGPDLFPTLIGIGLIICGLILIARGLRAYRLVPQWVQTDAIDSSNGARVNTILLLTALLLYILFSSLIGFIPMSIMIMATLLYRLGSSLLAALTIALVATLIIQFVFAKVLLVPLPPGLLQGLVW